MEDAPILEQLWREFDDASAELKIAEEEVLDSRKQLKITQDKFKRAKSSVYQSIKNRTNLRKEVSLKKRRVTTYSSVKRRWAKKNMGKIIEGFEEDL